MSQLVRFAPGTEMRRLRNDLDTVFRDFFGPVAESSDGWTPAVEIRETEDAYHVQIDVPGIRKEDIQIDFHNGTLAVSGERRMVEKSEGESVVRVERRYGSFYRSFGLPMQVDSDNIRASYEDGVLRLDIPKAEESKPRRIAVS